METFSALLAICVGNSPCLWRGALKFSLICTRINGWVNDREAGDLRRHPAHYDVTVISKLLANVACLVGFYKISLSCPGILYNTWTNACSRSCDSLCFFYAVNKNVCSRSLNSLRFWCTKYFEIKCQACRNIKRSLQNYSIQFQLIWLWSHRMLNRWSLLFNIPKICFFSDHIPWKIFPNYKHFLRRINHWYIPVAKGQ